MAEKDTLSPSLRKQLLARAHKIEPLVVVGHGGAGDSVFAQIRHVLKTHDLIKVRIQAEDRQTVQATAEELAANTEAVLVTKIGKIAVLYREIEEEEAAEEKNEIPQRPATRGHQTRPLRPQQRKPRRGR